MLTRDRIMSALTENDCAAADLRALGVNALNQTAILCEEGLVGRRAGRYYARRCETGTEARHCHVHGCETHTVIVHV